MLAPGLLLDVVLRLMCVRRSGGILHALSDCVGRAGSSPYHAEEMLVKVFAGSVRCCDLAGIAWELLEKLWSGSPMKHCWQKPVTCTPGPCIPQLRGPAPSCCSLWSLLAPQQGSFLSTRLLSNDLKMRNDCLDNKYYKNQDIQISLTIFFSFLFNDKIAYKEDSAKQQGMERTYSRIINRASSSAPAAATPSNPDAWWRHEWGNMQPWKDWDDDVLFLFPIRLIVLKNNLVTDNARKKKKDTCYDFNLLEVFTVMFF